MSEKTWPETLCAGDDDPRRSLREPMRVDGWKVCTDAKTLVAVEGGEECEPANDHNAEEIRRNLSLELRDPATFDLDALSEWCGPAEGGYVECRCSDCGNVHHLAVSRYDIDRVGSLFDVPFSKRLLAAMDRRGPWHDSDHREAPGGVHALPYRR